MTLCNIMSSQVGSEEELFVSRDNAPILDVDL